MSKRLPQATRDQVRIADQGRCGYCQSAERLVWGKLEIDHIVPRARGGTDDISNLCLCCAVCNSFKQARLQAPDPATGELVDLFHPRRQRWSEHFRWIDDGTRIEGLSPAGRATVAALQFNDLSLVETRRLWVSWNCHPPPGG